MENLQSRQALMNICSEIGPDDLEKLKFLLKDVIGSAKLESVDSAIDLFSAMERNKHVSLRDGRYLVECFCLMKRNDLVGMLNLVPATIQEEMEASPRISPFRSLLYNISTDLTEKEYNQMRFYCINTFKRGQLEKVKNVFDLFVLLERDTCISPTSTTVLKDMMRSLDRGDLLDLINEYQEKYPQSVDCESNPDTFSTNTGTLPISSQDKASMGLPTSTVVDMNTSTDLTSSQTSNRSTNSTLIVDVYEMTAHPRGLCIIINNSNFRNLNSRTGSDFDADKLQNTFYKLGFLTKIHPDLKTKDMVDVLKDVSDLDHSKYNALIVCILSHGDKYVIYGVDDQSVPISDLTKFFRSSKCKTLANKPKLFFIQACQGKKKQKGLDQSDLAIQTDGPSEDQQESFPETDADEITSTDTTIIIRDTTIIIPDECDFLIGFATVIGYASFRRRFTGSFYIEKLTENLDKYADSIDLVTLLTKVNNDVSEENIRGGEGGEIKKQVPMPQYTLRKQLYFSPHNLPTIYSQCSEASPNSTSDSSS